VSKLPVQHRPGSFLPEVSECFEKFSSWASLRPVAESEAAEEHVAVESAK